MLFTLMTIFAFFFVALTSIITINQSLVLGSASSIIHHTDGIDPNIIEDSRLKVPELIKKYNYPAEIHTVETQDGYLLQMHRIKKTGGQPVVMMHGLLDASSTWIIMGPNKGLAYMLSDLGYDVWMGNARGNRYSRNHKIFDPNKTRFWQFSFHEIGKYDLPAMIDYVLNVTDYKKLHYIGHSQGTTAFWIFSSENPDYVDKVLSMHALAPVAYLNHVRSIVCNIIMNLMRQLTDFINLIEYNEFLPNNEAISQLGNFFCKDGIFTQEFCTLLTFSITGFNYDEMNKTMLPVVYGHTPAGASTKQVIHFAQINHSGKFRQYDFGKAENLKKYGNPVPPDYDFNKIKVKVALYYSNNDWISGPEDVDRLYENLPMPIGKFLVDPNFSHLDFSWGINARPTVYEKIVKNMKMIEQNSLT